MEKQISGIYAQGGKFWAHLDQSLWILGSWGKSQLGYLAKMPDCQKNFEMTVKSQ